MSYRSCKVGVNVSNKFTFTISVGAPNMSGVSIPLRKALISGIPGPAAVGAKKTTRTVAIRVSKKLDPVNIINPAIYLQPRVILSKDLQSPASYIETQKLEPFFMDVSPIKR